MLIKKLFILLGCFLFVQGSFADFESSMNKFVNPQKSEPVKMSHEPSMEDEDQTTFEKSFYLTIAGGPAFVSGNSGSSYVFDLDFIVSQRVLSGMRFVVSAEKSKDPDLIFALNVKFFVLENYNGPFLNICFFGIDDGSGKDKNSKNKIIYASAGIGAGWSFRLYSAFSLVAGIDLSVGATEKNNISNVSAYLGFMF